MRKILLALIASIIMLTSFKSKEDEVIISSIETIYLQLNNNNYSILIQPETCPFYNIDIYTCVFCFIQEMKFNNPEQIKIKYSDNTTATITYLLKYTSPRIQNDGEVTTINAKKIDGKWKFDITNFFGSYIVKERIELEKESISISDSISKYDKLQEQTK
jgi:hypothetical protein